MITKLSSFNSLDKAEVELYLDQLETYFEMADAKRNYWQNKDDTLVLKLKDPNERPNTTMEIGVILGQLPGKLGADEFDRMVEDYEIYYRIWWD